MELAQSFALQFSDISDDGFESLVEEMVGTLFILIKVLDDQRNELSQKNELADLVAVFLNRGETEQFGLQTHRKLDFLHDERQNVATDENRFLRPPFLLSLNDLLYHLVQSDPLILHSLLLDAVSPDHIKYAVFLDEGSGQLVDELHEILFEALHVAGGVVERVLGHYFLKNLVVSVDFYTK